MANRTEKTAKTVKGTNPQFLVEKIIRQRIYDSMYWKEHCFALTGKKNGWNLAKNSISCFLVDGLETQKLKELGHVPNLEVFLNKIQFLELDLKFVA